MQNLGRRLNDAEGASLWQEEVQFGRGLGLRDHLEFKEDAVDRRLLAGIRDLVGHVDQRRSAGRNSLADCHIDLPTRPALKVRAVHVGGAAHHHRAGDHILTDGCIGEPLRRPDRHLFAFGQDAADAAEVINVAVRVQHRADLSLAASFAVERQRRGSTLW
ncbi:unannotated protein [freshwater metagenome]|uniref:Unannotated protein n=1 Tax=freshwater metagenome TaxID=449393 RepID=A0A6J7RVE6_9ZZZZ